MEAKSQGNLNYTLMLPFLLLTDGMQFSCSPPLLSSSLTPPLRIHKNCYVFECQTLKRTALLYIGIIR